LVFGSCQEEDKTDPCFIRPGVEGTTRPGLSASDPLEVTDSSAVLIGSIGPPTCERSIMTNQGLVWSNEANPDTSDNLVRTTPGGIYYILSDLDSNTTYYYRTFGVVHTSILYSNEIAFSTLP